jgi:glutamyl-tRNA reductase
VVEELSERLMQKLMHQPTVGLQKAAIDEKNDVLEMAQYLFNPHQKETNFS